MSENFDGNKPPVNVEFTQTEQANNQKTTMMLQQNFMRQHAEITALTTSDLTDMIRQEKQMYANLGIAFAVNAIAAMEKVRKK